MRFIRPTMLTLAVVLPLACASGGGPRSSTGSANALTREQMMETGHSTLYDAIRQLRPQWFRVRGLGTTSGTEQIQVYVDGVRRGGVEFLQSIRINSVSEVRRISANDATTRWGTGHRNGAIEVIRRR